MSETARVYTTSTPGMEEEAKPKRMVAAQEPDRKPRPAFIPTPNPAVHGHRIAKMPWATEGPITAVRRGVLVNGEKVWFD